MHLYIDLLIFIMLLIKLKNIYLEFIILCSLEDKASILCSICQILIISQDIMTSAILYKAQEECLKNLRYIILCPDEHEADLCRSILGLRLDHDARFKPRT